MTPEEHKYGAMMFAALANPARLQILEVLAEGPASVSRIAEAAGLRQSMASQHLSALLRAGVVVKHAEGNLRIYSLRGPRIAQVLRLVDEFYTVHIDNLRQLLKSH